MGRAKTSLQPTKEDPLLFEQINGSKPRTVPITLGYMVFSVLVVILLVFPLVFPYHLDARELMGHFDPPLPPLSEHVIYTTPVPKNRPAGPVKNTQQPPPPGFYIPTEVPKDIPVVWEPTENDKPTGPVTRGLPFGRPCVGAECVTGGTDEFLPPPPVPPPPLPPPVPEFKTQQPVRQGGNVTAANLINQVKPIYPTLARQARIQGVVVLEAVIDRQGAVTNLKVITGHPLLVQAALDAVKQWRYKPTQLNGSPVEVITTVTVNFAFSQ